MSWLDLELGASAAHVGLAHMGRTDGLRGECGWNLPWKDSRYKWIIRCML